MEKKPKAAPTAKAGKPASGSKHPMLVHLGRIKVNIGKNRSTVANVALILLAVCAWAIVPFLSAAKTGMLYLIANNGKLSGRADGNVYQRNGRVRAFKVPSLVQNVYTSTARAMLSMLSSAWAALTQSQRESWLNVDNASRTNRFGQVFAVRGKELFVERNANLLNAGNTIIDEYNTSEGVPASILDDVNAGQTLGVFDTLELGFEPAPTSADATHLVYATAPLGAGISKPKASAYRLIGRIDPGTATPHDMAAQYIAKYGSAVAAGLKIGVKMTAVNNSTGQAGGTSVFIATVN